MNKEKNKNVLMVSWAYYPRSTIGSHRAGKFVKYLPCFGWNPVVLTVKEKYYYPLVDEALLSQIPEGINVIRTSDLSLSALARSYSGKRSL